MGFAMKYAALVLLLLTGLLLAPSPASGESHATFLGSCAFVGETRFEPGFTMQSQEVAVSAADVPGHCTGELTTASGERRSVLQEPTTTTVVGSGSHSCVGGSSEGTGYFDIAGERIDFTFRLSQLTALTTVSVRGAGGGTASAVFTPDLSPTNFAVVLGCLQPRDQSAVSGRLDLVTTSALSG